MKSANRGAGVSRGSKRATALITASASKAAARAPVSRPPTLPPGPQPSPLTCSRKRTRLEDDEEAEDVRPAQHPRITPPSFTRSFHRGAAAQPPARSPQSHAGAHPTHKTLPAPGFSFRSRPGFPSLSNTVVRPTNLWNAPSAVGLINLGNTCYLNAVLQSLFSLPGFSGAVRAAEASCGKTLPRDSILPALSRCIDSREDAGARRRISPEEIKAAVGRRLGAFRGSFQQDAHEFFLALLEGAQAEVLAADVARLERRQVRASETADLATREFGFSIEQETRCCECNAVSCIVEQATHLSLDLPPYSASTMVPLGVDAMLGSYFKKESLSKACEKCGGEDVAHTVSRRIKRMPRVLALHMKRFKVNFSSSSSGGLSCTKVQTRVTIPPSVRLRQFCIETPTAPLPPAPVPAGKENKAPYNDTRGVGAGVGVGEYTPVVKAGAQRDIASFYHGACTEAAGASQSNYWEAPPARKRNGFISEARGILAAAKGDYQFEDTALAIALEESKKEAGNIHSEEEEALATAIKKSLEEQEQQQQERLTISAEVVAEAEAAVPGAVEEEDKKPQEEPEFGGFVAAEVVDDDAKGVEGNIVPLRPGTLGNENSGPVPLGHYRLQAVISHHGSRVDSGHFTADTRDAATGEWHRYNDAQVYRIQATDATNTLRQSECYMLFYILDNK